MAIFFKPLLFSNYRKNCTLPTGITVYQVFYDKKTKKNAEDFLNKLEKCIQILKPSMNLRFVFGLIEIKEILHKDKLTILDVMKDRDVYKLGNEKVYEIWVDNGELKTVNLFDREL